MRQFGALTAEKTKQRRVGVQAPSARILLSHPLYPSANVTATLAMSVAVATLVFPLTGCTPTANAQQATKNTAVQVQVDVTKERHPISPLIYGVAFANKEQAELLHLPVNRWGGNSVTRYNWKLNADSKANDWFYMSIASENKTPSADADAFVSSNKAAGAKTMFTIPYIGWVAKVNDDRSPRWSFSEKKYGKQEKTEQYHPDAGNGMTAAGKPVTGNDPTDANEKVDVAFMQGWAKHLVSTFGKASEGGIAYYMLDNEPGLFHSTHRDVFPVGIKMDDEFARMRDTATMLKGVDPTALVCGPNEWGWTGYQYSGYDSQYGPKVNWDATKLPDRAAHGGVDMNTFILKQFAAEEKRAGKRLLDVFTLHFYPQGGEFNNGTDEAMQKRRNRSTRALWDKAYKDETWINDTVMLVPRMKALVKDNYPGTKIGLTEYNWGAESHINGATAQADILGILGREGMDVATRWTTPDAKTPTFKAMQLFTNADGKGLAFGETSVSCTVPEPDNLSAFAAQGKDGTVTVMLVHKQLTGDTPVTLAIAGATVSGTAQVYQVTSANRIEHLKDATVAGGKVTLTVPAQSVTLLVVK